MDNKLFSECECDNECRNCNQLEYCLTQRVFKALPEIDRDKYWESYHEARKEVMPERYNLQPIINGEGKVVGLYEPESS